MIRRWALPLLLLAFGVFYLLPLATHGLWIPDETRHAQISQEMLLTGKWASPHFMGLRYFEKPIAGYWMIALSQGLFGQNLFGVRFASALATGLSVLLCYRVARRPVEPAAGAASQPISASTICHCPRGLWMRRARARVRSPSSTTTLASYSSGATRIARTLRRRVSRGPYLRGARAAAGGGVKERKTTAEGRIGRAAGRGAAQSRTIRAA